MASRSGSGWRSTGGNSDSEDDLVFVGPVSQRELEISRLLNETICLADNSGSMGDSLAGIESGLNAVNLEGTRESLTMNELELPASRCSFSYPVTSSRLADVSGAPPASSEDSSSRQWQERPSVERLSSATPAEHSQHWEEMPSETPLALHQPTEESQHWEEMPSEAPRSLPPPAEESQHWEEMPSEAPLSLPPPAEESQHWEEMPSEAPLSLPPPAEESQHWEEMPSEAPLSFHPPSEASQQWEEMPSEAPLSFHPPSEASRQWEEMPSEAPLSLPPPTEEPDQWSDLPSGQPLSSTALAERTQSKVEPPSGDTSAWQTLLSDDLENREPGDSLDERREPAEPGDSPGQRRRETAGSLLGALREELADAGRVSAISARSEYGSPAAVSPRSAAGGGGGGLLRAMHRQMSSPGGRSVDSYHTCHTSLDASRRITGLSELSAAPGSPPGGREEWAAPLGDSTMDALPPPPESLGSAAEEEALRHDRMASDAGGRPSIAETRSDNGSVVDTTRSDNGSVADATRSDNGSVADITRSDVGSVAEVVRAESAGGRVSGVSPVSGDDREQLASPGSAGWESQSELNDTLEMMDRLLAMEAEERRLEAIIQSRSGAADSTQARTEEESRHSQQPQDGSYLEPPPATAARPTSAGRQAVRPRAEPAGTARGRGRAAPPRATAARSPGRLLTPHRRPAAPSPGRLLTPHRRPPAPSPGRSAPPSTPSAKSATVAPPPATPRTKPNLTDVVSPVARYIHDLPPPALVQNLRPRARLMNSAVPQPRGAAHTLTALAEEGDDAKERAVLHEHNVSSDASAGAHGKTPLRVSAGGQENQKPRKLPEVSYKSSGNLVMGQSQWNQLVKKNTAENRKISRFLPSPKPVLAVKHTGHRSVASRRVRWNDEFSVPDMAVRVRPMRRSVSDVDLSQASDASLMEVSDCEVRSARPLRN